ncbi:MAG: cytochrome c family protein [Sphingomicrobium sp.]
MDDRFNTFAGWVLFAGIVALGSSIVAGEAFHAERPEKMGYPIPGVVEDGPDGADAEQPIEAYLASADVAKGEQSFKKCAACHNAAKGGPNALGPNLWGTIGAPIGQGGGFAFTEALSGKGGNWDWTNMSEWLKSPRTFAPGTKMTFAGLGDPQERANVIAYLNQQSDSPQPMPAAPAAAPPTDASADKPGTGPGDGAQKAEKEPVINATGAADPKGAGEADPE